jgi:T-complex protein 1 subunit zeta
VEDVKEPKSVTVLVKGPNGHTIKQIQDAIRDGLRAVNNAIRDRAVVAGAGAFETALFHQLEGFKKTVEGKRRLGVEAFLEIPCVISANAGHDAIDTIVALQNAADRSEVAGVDIETGDVLAPSVPQRVRNIH